MQQSKEAIMSNVLYIKAYKPMPVWILARILSFRLEVPTCAM